MLLAHGAPANLTPLLPAQNPVWWEGAAAIFANCAFLLCGFQAVSQVVEEKSGPPAIFHPVPHPGADGYRRRRLLLRGGAGHRHHDALASLPPHSLAFVEVTRLAARRPVLVPLVLVIAILSLLKTWNGCFLMASRTLIALTREGLMPAWMNKWHGRTGVPRPSCW